MPLNLKARVCKGRRSIWEWLKIIYLAKPLRVGGKAKGMQYPRLAVFRRYATIAGSLIWLFPWTFAFFWVWSVVLGCQYGWLENVCLRSYLTPTTDIPWHLDLWNPHDVTANSSIPPHIERIMTGHTALRDTAMALSDQVSKTSHLGPDLMTEGNRHSLCTFKAMYSRLYG